MHAALEADDLNSVGPRKLARSMQHAYKRWTGLTKASPPTSTPSVNMNGETRKPSFNIGMLSPLEELNSLALYQTRSKIGSEIASLVDAHSLALAWSREPES